MTWSPEEKENGQKVLRVWEHLPEKQPLRLGVKRLRDARAHRAVIKATLAGPLLSMSFPDLYNSLDLFNTFSVAEQFQIGSFFRRAENTEFYVYTFY